MEDYTAETFRRSARQKVVDFLNAQGRTGYTWLTDMSLTDANQNAAFYKGRGIDVVVAEYKGDTPETQEALGKAGIFIKQKPGMFVTPEFIVGQVSIEPPYRPEE